VQTVCYRTIKCRLSATEQLIAEFLLQLTCVQNVCYRTVDCRLCGKEQFSADYLLENGLV